jgi:hypothetical protein
MNTRQTATSRCLHPICSVCAALANVSEYVIKLDDAPASAQEHLDHAIFILSEMCREWQPSDADIMNVIMDAREHMAHYYELAKSPWPNA